VVDAALGIAAHACGTSEAFHPQHLSSSPTESCSCIRDPSVGWLTPHLASPLVHMAPREPLLLYPQHQHPPAANVPLSPLLPFVLQLNKIAWMGTSQFFGTSSALSQEVQTFPDHRKSLVRVSLQVALERIVGGPSVPPFTNLNPQLDYFVAYALHHMWLHSSVTFAILYLLQLLEAHFHAAKESSGSIVVYLFQCLCSLQDYL
jgi:hypothetical protein